MPSHAHLMVRDGEEVFAGDVVAKIPRATTKTKDITGGLPRVVELFEARPAGETAIISEINGLVRFGEVAKGMRKVHVVGDDGQQREYLIPRGVHISVQESERVRAGDPLMDGPRNPHDILQCWAESELQKYMVNEIQEVYRLQGVTINDKHLEVISRQMMRWVKVEENRRHGVSARRGRRQVQVPRGEPARHRSRRQARRRQGDPAGDHQGVAIHGLVHLRRILPGDHPSAHRGRHQRQGGSPAGAQGKRHHGAAHPGGYRHGVLPARQIVGEDIEEEEPVAEPEIPLTEIIPGYEDETRLQYNRRAPEGPGEEPLTE